MQTTKLPSLCSCGRPPACLASSPLTLCGGVAGRQQQGVGPHRPDVVQPLQHPQERPRVLHLGPCGRKERKKVCASGHGLGTPGGSYLGQGAGWGGMMIGHSGPAPSRTPVACPPPQRPRPSSLPVPLSLASQCTSIPPAHWRPTLSLPAAQPSRPPPLQTTPPDLPPTLGLPAPKVLHDILPHTPQTNPADPPATPPHPHPWPTCRKGPHIHLQQPQVLQSPARPGHQHPPILLLFPLPCRLPLPLSLSLLLLQLLFQLQS